MAPEKNATSIDDILSDAWDYKGRPSVRPRSGGWSSAAMILGVELCERLTTLGIGVNLVTYLTGRMHIGNAEAANVVTNFMGTSFMLCLFGGLIADTFIGRYLTIAIFAAVQAAGVTILSISTAVNGLHPPTCNVDSSNSCIRASGEQLGVLYLALYLTALGTGGLKSSVSGFGSDQFDETNRAEKNQMMQFFNWFFFFISLGSLFAVTVLVYIQDNVGRKYGYGLCAAAICVALIVFLLGTRRYRFKKLAGSPLTQIAAVIVAAWRKRKVELPANPALLYDDVEVKKENVEEEKGSMRSKVKQRLPHTDQFRFLDHAAINKDPNTKQSKWRLSTLTDVEEVKIIARMLPIWATTIMFWTVYAQMATFSVAQATTMNRHIGSSFEIPAGSLTVFFVGSILLTVPIYDRIVVPVSRKFTGNPHGLTPLQRIGIGLVMSILAMVSAALIEIKRINVAKSNPVYLQKGSIVPMRVFWLIPQFFLVGSGEAFTYIGQLDFFLRECPKGMKTMSTGLFLTTLSLGFFVSSILVTVVHKITDKTSQGAWLADNLNVGKLYYFYWLLAAICCVNFLFYLVAAKWYVYKDTRMQVEDESMAGIELTEAEANCA